MATTRNDGQRPTIGVTAPSSAGAMALERPSMAYAAPRAVARVAPVYAIATVAMAVGMTRPRDAADTDTGDQEQVTGVPDGRHRLRHDQAGKTRRAVPVGGPRYRRPRPRPDRTPPGPRPRAGTGSRGVGRSRRARCMSGIPGPNTLGSIPATNRASAPATSAARAPGSRPRSITNSGTVNRPMRFGSAAAVLASMSVGSCVTAPAYRPCTQPVAPSPLLPETRSELLSCRCSWG